MKYSIVLVLAFLSAINCDNTETHVDRMRSVTGNSSKAKPISKNSGKRQKKHQEDHNTSKQEDYFEVENTQDAIPTTTRETETNIEDLIDTSEEGIIAFIESGQFEEWKDRQPVPINGVTAHRRISQTYVNQIAAEALAEDVSIFPVGSILVKTMFGKDRETVVGHALMAKIQPGPDNNTWVWFEGFLPRYSNPFYGRRVSICLGCHSEGIDYVRTEYESLEHD